MTDPTMIEIADLRRRVARIEAIEACKDRFNAYLYYLDAGHLEDLLSLFADAAKLELQNFPPGTGGDLSYTGNEEIKALYAAFVGEGARHHSANVSVVPSEALDQVEITAYFLTTIEYTLTGGIYELQFQPGDTTWQISRMRISSTWGWAIPHTDPPFLKESFSAGTLRNGHPPSANQINWK